MNKLYIVDYCVWIQSKLTDDRVKTLADSFNKSKRELEGSQHEGKEMVGLGLVELEAVVDNMEEEEEEEST